MKNNQFDLVTDLVKRRIGLAIGEAQKRFKNTNPYRMEKVTDEDRIKDYQSLTPDKIDFARKSFGDATVDAYLSKMLELKNKAGGQNA